MSKAELLLDLQDIDSAIDRLNRRLTEIRAALHETDELIAARSALRAAEESVTQKRAHRKDLELADASLVEAQAPPAIERDTPANPKAGKALLRRLLFFEERFDMAQFSRLFGAY